MTDGQTDQQKFPCVLRDFVPFGDATRKKEERKMVRKKGGKEGIEKEGRNQGRDD